MSSKSKTKSAADRQLDESVTQFCGITGASTKDARAFMTKFKRLDVAVDAYYNDPNQLKRAGGGGGAAEGGPSTSKITALFEQYKEPDADDIGIDGTLRWCEDLATDPEDVVLLAVAHELKSPRMGHWEKKGWVDGWKALGADTLPGMQAAIERLRTKLGSDAAYFQKVYSYTFDFGRSEGQRSLGAIPFWALLIPAGLAGGALAHVPAKDDDMDDGDGWKEEYTQWWFDFLTAKGGKGVSKDTWSMFLEFVRTIDSKFEMYDMEAAWPSAIDDFVEYAKERLASGRE